MQSCSNANARLLERQCILRAFLVWHSPSVPNSSTIFFEDSWYFSNQVLFWNKVLSLEVMNALLHPPCPKCCLVTSNGTSPNWIHIFLLTSKLSIVIPSVCLPFFWSAQSFNMCEIDRLLGICDFAPTLLCQTTKCEALWGCLYFGTFDGPGL